ncbi:MAG: hypothetical protein K2X61_09515, partial [Caulobacteraceae bacterium]|nr:hypothetical protein [Caulobacteraceae bacterium]
CVPLLREAERFAAMHPSHPGRPDAAAKVGRLAEQLAPHVGMGPAGTGAEAPPSIDDGDDDDRPQRKDIYRMSAVSSPGLALAVVPLGYYRRDFDAERARTAWLLAADLAQGAVDGPTFVRIVATPGKVGRGSDARTAIARKIACYLSSVVANVPPAAVGRAAQLDRKTVHSHVAEIEDMRDDPAIDRLMEELREAMIRRAVNLVMANLGEAA